MDTRKPTTTDSGKYSGGECCKELKSSRSIFISGMFLPGCPLILDQLLGYSKKMNACHPGYFSAQIIFPGSFAEDACILFVCCFVFKVKNELVDLVFKL